MIGILVVVALVIYVTATIVRESKTGKESALNGSQEAEEAERVAYEQRAKRLEEVFKESREISLDEFFIIKDTQGEDVPGVYILHNTSNEKYYVGQSSHILRRVTQHFLVMAMEMFMPIIVWGTSSESAS